MVQDRVDQCEKEQSIQESKIVQQDLYSRRWNLLFFGFDEEQDESCEKKVTQVTKSVGLDGRFVRFCGVHRLGRKQKARNGQSSRPRSIIARFTCRVDRDTVWRVHRDLQKCKNQHKGKSPKGDMGDTQKHFGSRNEKSP